MKKKLLSLALVFAMALTLLPTAAFAAHTKADGSTCNGTLTWVANASDANTHEPSCSENCGDTSLVSHTASFTGTPSKDSGADTHTYTCAGATGCTLTKTENCAAASTPTYNKVDGTNHAPVCEACAEVISSSAAAHDYTGTPAKTDETNHTYTCAANGCGATKEEAHDTSDGGKCSKCGYDPNSQTPTEKSITVGNVTFNAASGLKASVAFTAKGVTGTFTVKMTTAGGSVKTATGSASPIEVTLDAVTAATTYTIEISAADGTKGNGSATYTPGASQPEPPETPDTPTTPVTPETPKEDKTPPSTNSQGIPVASEVSNSTQANQAITILKNTNADTLQQRLMTSESAASSFASLESAVKSAKGIRVSVDTSSSSAPSAVRSGVSVTGAAFNASGTSVRLVVDAPSSAYNISSGYQISMTMSGVSNPEKLAVPVIITLPVPSDVRADRLVVLHYHNGSSNPTTIVPVISGNSLRFTVTGFSDFVVTDADATVGNGVSGAYTTVQGGNRGENELDALLPAIAAMLSGDGVFVDVTKEHWAAKEIRWARDGGLMSGYENGYFRPTASTTRQQLWMVLARLSGTRPADMAMARQWAINTGVSDGSNPSGVLSRQQLVTMLYRFAKSQGVNVSASAKLGGYADSAAVAPYAKEALSWAAAKGIVSGSNGKLNPEGTATRAHFAVFLYRYSHG